jgi:hypothetical protein
VSARCDDAVDARLRTRGGVMTGFIQIMEFKTDKVDELEDMARKMRAELGERLLATRSIVTNDRDNPGTYRIIVEFPDYETAMKNSNDPMIGEFSKKMGEIIGGAPKFLNLDVREEID